MHRALSMLMILLVACAQPVGPTTTPPPTIQTTTTTQATTTTTAPTTTTTEETTSTSVAEVEIEVVVEDGGSSLEGQRVAAKVGESVVIRVRSDVADEVHLHGYDLFEEVTAGGEAELRLVADVPGIFEVELEAAHILLFSLEVAP